MSLQVLSKKAKAKYGNHNGKNGFSLNNSRRVASHQNQPQTQTPFLGNVPKGNGGFSGQYTIQINQSQYKNIDPFNEPKPTTLSNHALLSKKLRCLNSGYPNNVVQPTYQNDYETYVNQKVANLTTRKSDYSECNPCRDNAKMSNYVKNTGPMDYDVYIKTQLKTNNCLNPPKLTYPPRISKNSTLGCYDSISYEDYVNQKSC